MITFAEGLLFVTAAGMLLGRREISAGARFLGIGVGRVVGMLQGARVKYEQRTRGTELYELHRSVKRGLADMSTIGNDLASIRSGSISAMPVSGGALRQPAPNMLPVGAAPTAGINGAAIPTNTAVKTNTGLHVFENTLEIEQLKHLIGEEEAKDRNSKRAQ